MFLSFDEVSGLIESGTILHVAGSEGLLKKLPAGNWIGGSTEYFMTPQGGRVSGDMFFVTEFKDVDFKIVSYGSDTIDRVATDAYDNGFSIAIIPFGSETHITYAHNASNYDGMFIKNIVGWISGFNLSREEQTPVAVNGQTGDILPDKAVVMHIRIPDDKTVNIDIVNIFEQDGSTPVIEFDNDGFSTVNCRVNGESVVLADYIAQNGINTKLPLVGDYSGAKVNTSFKAIEDGVVSFYAPVFKGIKYRIAKPITDYAGEFGERLAEFKDTNSVFSCSCILNFLYGELENKELDTFFGPITFGEIAYQLVNQTLVYVSVLDN